MSKVIVIKIGGSTLGSHDTTIEDIVSLQKQGKSVVVVHGGGKIITDWLKKIGVETEFVRGQRVTDKMSLEVATAVLAGLVNKEIVVAINSMGGRAVGISGVDGALLQAKIENVELGYVGQVDKVNLLLLKTLLKADYIPVISSIGIDIDGGKTKESQLLNINADTAAGEIAATINAEKLIFLTDVAGICNAQGELIPQLSLSEAEDLIVTGVVSGGMIPKIKACLRALFNTETTSIIDGREPHSLARNIAGESGGTRIKGGLE
ncbi:acetylglutamate kinase [Chloroflexota bacterium]